MSRRNREIAHDDGPSDDSTVLAQQSFNKNIPLKTDAEKLEQATRRTYRIPYIARALKPGQLNAFDSALASRGVQFYPRSNPALVLVDAGIIAQRTNYGQASNTSLPQLSPYDNAEQFLQELYKRGLPTTANQPVEVVRKNWTLKGWGVGRVSILLHVQDSIDPKSPTEKPPSAITHGLGILSAEQRFTKTALRIGDTQSINSPLEPSLTCAIGSVDNNIGHLTNTIWKAWKDIPKILEFSSVAILPTEYPKKRS